MTAEQFINQRLSTEENSKAKEQFLKDLESMSCPIVSNHYDDYNQCEIDTLSEWADIRELDYNSDLD